MCGPAGTSPARWSCSFTPAGCRPSSPTRKLSSRNNSSRPLTDCAGFSNSLTFSFDRVAGLDRVVWFRFHGPYNMPNREARPLLRGPELLEPRALPAASFTELPVLPDFDPATLATVRRIAYLGMVHGLRSDAFLKVGDSNTATTDFLQAIGQPGYNPVLSGLTALPVAIQDAVRAFRSPLDAAGDNSFTRVSLAAGYGWTVPMTVAG